LALLFCVVHADGHGTASNDQLVIAEHEILDGCPETGLISSHSFLTSTIRGYHTLVHRFLSFPRQPFYNAIRNDFFLGGE